MSAQRVKVMEARIVGGSAKSSRERLERPCSLSAMDSQESIDARQALLEQCEYGKLPKERRLGNNNYLEP